MGPYEPYEEATEALEDPHFALDTPFVDYTYTEPAQWSYQGPPTSPQFQPEPMLYHPYSPPLPFQQPIPHLPITQPFHPTHHNRPTGLNYPSGPTLRTQPRARRGLHQSSQQHRYHPQTRRGTHLGSKDGNRARSSRREERGMDFHEAMEAIRQVIVFARSLPHVMNNRRNAERRIRQRETRRARSGTSTTSSSCGHSPIPQALKPLPPPGVGAYRPPMLQDPPLHLDSDIAPKASMAFTLSAHGVDSHCKAAKPSRDISCTDSSTQPTVGPDLDLSQENSKKFNKKPRKFRNKFWKFPVHFLW